MSDPISEALFKRAQAVIPGGVNSPVRAFRSVGGTPIFIARAYGAMLVGVDGREYVDFVGSWGPMILGHTHPAVVAAIQSAALRGSSYGAPTEHEVEMAERIRALVPSIEMVRLTSSGTEAVMGALRVARGFTRRDLVIKCEGAYHGGADYLLVKAGSGAATLGEPDSAGVPAAIASTTVLVRHNDLDAARAALTAHPGQVAAVIVEPVVGNMGCVPPEPGYLAGLRALCDEHGALLVFDEVMTGFRVHPGGAQALYGVRPDLTCLGKIVGGGLPLAAYGGAADIMRHVSPVGTVYQAGTLSGNPLAVAAGLATLGALDRSLYERLEAQSAELERHLVAAAAAARVPVVVQRVGSMFTVFFTANPVRSWDDATRADRGAFRQFHGALLAAGIYWPPSQFEAAFLSAAHDEGIMSRTFAALPRAFEAARD